MNPSQTCAFEQPEQRYFAATRASRALYEQAREVLPDGIGDAGIPFMGTGGGLPADTAFLLGLRNLCDQYGIVLIFDEMIAIGIGSGGAQGHLDIRPNLTATGKLVAGGMPIGVFGGRTDVMALPEPRTGIPSVLHKGTWNCHALTMAAGAAQLRRLDDAAYAYLSHIGDDFRSRTRALIKEIGLAVAVAGTHHFSALHYSDRDVRVPNDVPQGDQALARRVAFSLLSQVFLMFGGRSKLSTAITEADIENFIAALAIAFIEGGVPQRTRLNLTVRSQTACRGAVDDTQAGGQVRPNADKEIRQLLVGVPGPIAMARSAHRSPNRTQSVGFRPA